VAQRSFLSDMLRGPEQPHALQNARTGAMVARRVELAVDSESRRRGLLGRDRFEDGSALIIAPCSAIHTFFMRFAIDVVFVAKDGRVLKTYASVPARRIAFSVGAYAVIEFPAGTLARANATRGDELHLVPRQT
jgi:uncharacterized membrane protein (UPF0127 family)